MNDALMIFLMVAGHTATGFLILSLRDYFEGEDLTVEEIFKNLFLGFITGIGALFIWLVSLIDKHGSKIVIRGKKK